jgi:phosphopantothenoylcysteine decarboxylase/phosphopantothenate--cysteine ligase
MTPKKILLIITGSIACFKSIELIRLLKKKSFEVNCILTNGAKEFITPLLVSSISGTKTFDQLFSVDDEIEMGHINLSRQHDLIVIAPTSADFIAKIANGYGDDLASATILASDKKIIFAPAMNEKMWLNDITQKNITKILQNNLSMIEPEKDILACGEEGFGKMASPEKIVEEIEIFFKNQNILAGKNILITAGSTIEPIDPVRFIGNKSSGKQALAIAKILSEMGANVKIIAGNLTQEIKTSLKSTISVNTAQEMFEEVKNSLNSIDVFIGCSAVADYRVKNYSAQKIKKSTNQNLTLELEKNPDILEFVGTAPNRPTLVIGFCAESENLLENAKQKILNKNCDLIVANDIENGTIFGSDFTSAFFVEKTSHGSLFKGTKTQLAKNLADIIIKKLNR